MKKQRGISLIGFVIVGALVAAVVLVGFQMVPSYVEYFTIKKIMTQTLNQSKEATPAELRRNFELRMVADYVDTISARDIDISKVDGRVTMSASYKKVIHLVGNVSLLLEFEPTVQK